MKVQDSQVITTAFVSVLYFHGHMDNARMFMKIAGYMPDMLDKKPLLPQTAPAGRFAFYDVSANRAEA